MNRKTDFFTKRIDSHNESNRELECSNVHYVVAGCGSARHFSPHYIPDYVADINTRRKMTRGAATYAPSVNEL